MVLGSTETTQRPDDPRKLETGGRAQALAERFVRANRDVYDAIESSSGEQLRATCPAERCTIAALACHIAAVHDVVTGWIQSVVTGDGLPPLTMEQVDRDNGESFARDAECAKTEVLERLRRSAAAAARQLRTLSDADLDRTAPFSLFGGAQVSVQTLIEQILIGDPIQHLVGIRGTLSRSA
jgi:uncharacterized damage-inducible protein DinB